MGMVRPRGTDELAGLAGRGAPGEDLVGRGILEGENVASEGQKPLALGWEGLNSQGADFGCADLDDVGSVTIGAQTNAESGTAARGTVGIVLAAGAATRLQWGGRSKMLAPVGGRPLLAYALEAAAPWVDRLYLVVSDQLACQLGVPEASLARPGLTCVPKPSGFSSSFSPLAAPDSSSQPSLGASSSSCPNTGAVSSGGVEVAQHLSAHLKARIVPSLSITPVLQPAGGGTGLAVRLGLQAALADDPGVLAKDILVLCGDLPALESQDLAALMAVDMRGPQAPDVVVMAMEGPMGHHYGRLECAELPKSLPGGWLASLGAKRVLRIREAKDLQADHEQARWTAQQMNRPVGGPGDSSKAFWGATSVSGDKGGPAFTSGGGDLVPSCAFQSCALDQWCHTGVLRFQAAYGLPALEALIPSPATGELYLTDLVTERACCVALHADRVAQILQGGDGRQRMGLGAVVDVRASLDPKVEGGVLGGSRSFWGVNTQDELFQVEEDLQVRFRQRVRGQGALVHPGARLSFDTRAAAGAVIHGPSLLGPGVVVDRDAVIHPFCTLEGAHIQAGAQVGPFAHVRCGTTLGPGGHIGNFVETKNTSLGPGSKAKHLSYLGDAVLGANVTIGAGVITCNYDGHIKQTTTIGAGSFIGSHSCLIAPLVIGQSATVGAGSVVTQDVPDRTLALARMPQHLKVLSPDSKHLRRKTCATLDQGGPEMTHEGPP